MGLVFRVICESEVCCNRSLPVEVYGNSISAQMKVLVISEFARLSSDNVDFDGLRFRPSETFGETVSGRWPSTTGYGKKLPQRCEWLQEIKMAKRSTEYSMENLHRQMIDAMIRAAYGYIQPMPSLPVRHKRVQDFRVSTSMGSRRSGTITTRRSSRLKIPSRSRRVPWR